MSLKTGCLITTLMDLKGVEGFTPTEVEQVSQLLDIIDDLTIIGKSLGLDPMLVFGPLSNMLLDVTQITAVISGAQEFAAQLADALTERYKEISINWMDKVRSVSVFSLNSLILLAILVSDVLGIDSAILINSLTLGGAWATLQEAVIAPVLLQLFALFISLAGGARLIALHNLASKLKYYVEKRRQAIIELKPDLMTVISALQLLENLQNDVEILGGDQSLIIAWKHVRKARGNIGRSFRTDPDKLAEDVVVNHFSPTYLGYASQDVERAMELLYGKTIAEIQDHFGGDIGVSNFINDFNGTINQLKDNYSNAVDTAGQEIAENGIVGAIANFSANIDSLSSAAKLYMMGDALLNSLQSLAHRLPVSYWSAEQELQRFKSLSSAGGKTFSNVDSFLEEAAQQAFGGILSEFIHGVKGNTVLALTQKVAEYEKYVTTHDKNLAAIDQVASKALQLLIPVLNELKEIETEIGTYLTVSGQRMYVANDPSVSERTGWVKRLAQQKSVLDSLYENPLASGDGWVNPDLFSPEFVNTTIPENVQNCLTGLSEYLTGQNTSSPFTPNGQFSISDQPANRAITLGKNAVVGAIPAIFSGQVSYKIAELKEMQFLFDEQLGIDSTVLNFCNCITSNIEALPAYDLIINEFNNFIGSLDDMNVFKQMLDSFRNGNLGNIVTLLAEANMIPGLCDPSFSTFENFVASSFDSLLGDFMKKLQNDREELANTTNAQLSYVADITKLLPTIFS